MVMAVNVTVFPATQEQTVRTAEVLARAITGLAFEGIDVSLSLSQFDDEEEKS